MPKEVAQAANDFKRWKNNEHMSGIIRSYLGRANISADDNGRLLLVFENPVDAAFLNTEERKQEIKDAIAQYTGKKWKLISEPLRRGKNLMSVI